MRVYVSRVPANIGKESNRERGMGEGGGGKQAGTQDSDGWTKYTPVSVVAQGSTYDLYGAALGALTT